MTRITPAERERIYTRAAELVTIHETGKCGNAHQVRALLVAEFGISRDRAAEERRGDENRLLIYIYILV
jgi:hypothetical protein